LNSMIQRQMIYWTFGLVAIFGVAVVFFLVEPPTSIKRTTASANGRVPASLVEDTSVAEPDMTVPRVADVTMGCEQSEEKTVEANVHQARIHGEVCLPKVQNLSLVNSANGFSATIFNSDEKHFTTDYITLVNGGNKLILQLQLMNGSVQTRELHLLRQ
jgi:hypothetical protein